MVNRQPKIQETEAAQLSDELKEQFALEKWWLEDCKERYLRHSELLRQSGRVTTDKGVQHHLLRMAEQLGAHIEYTIENPKRGQISRNTLVIKKLIESIEPFELAYLLLGEATNAVMTSDRGFVTVPAMATLLAEAVNQEFKLRAMLKIAPEMPKIVRSVLKESRSTLSHRKRTFVTLFHKRTGKLVPSVFHDNDSRITAGNALVELLFTTPAMGVVHAEKAYDTKKRDIRWVIRPSDIIRDIFNKDLDADVLARKTIPLGVLLYPPGRRTFAPEMLLTYDPPPIKIDRLKGKLEAIGQTCVQKDLGVTRLLEALTYLEQTPLKINTQMLDFIVSNKDDLKSLGVLDNATLNLTPSPLPPDITPEEATEAQRDKFLEWKRYTEDQHNKFWKERAKVIKQERQIQLAAKLSTYPRFYQRWVADFRGRMYPVNNILSFQGNALSKALLEFADPVTLKVGDASDLAWCELIECGLRLNPTLAKVPTEALEHAYTDRKFLEATVNDALAALRGECTAQGDAYTYFTIYGRKNFLPFVSWVLHLRELLSQWGLECKSGHPIRKDATCSSMQHMAALAGDKKVLRATNCAPNAAKVEDLYRDLSPNPPIEGLDRDDLKKFVMTYAYNSTDYRRKKEIKEKFEEGLVKFEYRRVIEANEELKAAVAKGLGKVCTLQALLMEVFRALVVGRRIHALTVTPTEYVIDSEKWEFPTKQYRVHHFDATIKVRYKDLDQEPDINLKKTRQSWVANTIHAMDACLLHLSISCLAWIAESEHRVHLSTIHDCVVTRPGDMGITLKSLETAFAQMYKPNATSGMAEALHRLVEFWDLESFDPDLYKKFIKLKAAPEEMYQNMKYFFV